MEGLVFHNNNNLNTLCVTPSSLTYKRGLKRAAEDAEEQRPSPDIIQPAQTQQAAPPRVITGMYATIPQALWFIGATLVNGLVDLISSRHAPPAQQQAAQQHAATSQPTQITGVATDHSDRKRRAVDTSPINAYSNTSPAHTSPTARLHNRRSMHLNVTRRVHGTSAVSPAAARAASDRNNAAKATAAANRLAWYKQYYDPSLDNLAKEFKLAQVQESTTTSQPAAIDKSIPIKDRQIGGLIQKAFNAQGTTTAQKAKQKRIAAQEKAAARKEAAHAAEVALHIELDKKEEEERIAAEEEKQRVAAEVEKARIADEDDKQRIAAEQEEQRVAAEQEAQRVAAEKDQLELDACHASWLENNALIDAREEEEQRAIRTKQRKDNQRVAAERPDTAFSQTVVNLDDQLWESIGVLMRSGKQDRETVVQLGSIPLQMISFKRIVNFDGTGTESWLDDDAVNAWFNLIVEEKKRQTGYVKSDTNPPPFANLQSAWYAKYNTKEKAKGLKRWMKRAGVGGTNILKCKRIFLPINAGSHWTLLIINGVERSIEYLNSLGGNGERYFEIARDILKSELGDKYLDKDWSELKRNRSYQQSNMDDCGVFTCMNGLAAAKGRPYSDVQARFMYSAREMMAGVFLNGEKGFDEVIEL
jgi:Ulp1 family protease